MSLSSTLKLNKSNPLLGIFLRASPIVPNLITAI